MERGSKGASLAYDWRANFHRGLRSHPASAESRPASVAESKTALVASQASPFVLSMRRRGEMIGKLGGGNLPVFSMDCEAVKREGT